MMAPTYGSGHRQPIFPSRSSAWEMPLEMSLAGQSSPDGYAMAAGLPAQPLPQARGGMFASASRPAPASAGIAPETGLLAPPPDPAAITSTLGNDLPALNTNIAPQLDFTGMKARKPSFFEKDGFGSKLLEGLLQGTLYYGAAQGNQGSLAALEMRQRQQAAKAAREQELFDRQALWAREDATYDQRRADTQADREFERNAPQYFSAGSDRVRFDPVSGQTQVVYDGPSDAEDYARAIGLDPGSEDYVRAIKDHTLRGYGPSAMAGKLDLETDRQQNRVNLRSMPTYAQSHPQPRAPARAPTGTFGAPRTIGNVIAPIMAKMAAGKPLSPGETQLYQSYQSGRGRGGRPQGAAQPVRIQSQAEYARLPSGAVYIAPDGSKRTKK